jgi:hypothetical protein
LDSAGEPSGIDWKNTTITDSTNITLELTFYVVFDKLLATEITVLVFLSQFSSAVGNLLSKAALQRFSVKRLMSNIRVYSILARNMLKLTKRNCVL